MLLCGLRASASILPCTFPLLTSLMPLLWHTGHTRSFLSFVPDLTTWSLSYSFKFHGTQPRRGSSIVLSKIIFAAEQFSLLCWKPCRISIFSFCFCNYYLPSSGAISDVAKEQLFCFHSASIRSRSMGVTSHRQNP